MAAKVEGIAFPVFDISTLTSNKYGNAYEANIAELTSIKGMTEIKQ